MLTLQRWGPDTCGCRIHEGVEERSEDRPGDPQKLKIYLPYTQVLDLHVARFIRSPQTTIRWPMTALIIGSLPLSIRGNVFFRPLIRFMAWSKQAKARQCLYHAHLGETQELYDTVVEENTRKNRALSIAWQIANDVSDEDLLWLYSAPNKRIAEARQKVLEKIIPLLEIKWGFERDRRPFPHPLALSFPSYASIDWEQRNAIELRCAQNFGQGRVSIV